MGRHLAKELLARGEYNRVCIYSRDEVKQAVMRAEFNDNPKLRWLIGDVRDLPRLTRAMRGCESVIAAAALKRIETGFFQPDEMVKTNIIGMMNTIDAAASSKVSKFVFVSSDKAVEAKSPYGQSKALAESLTLNAIRIYGHEGPRYRVVRYGNVAGSTWSIIPTWREILKNSGTVPVTAPDATRFWMHVSEAVALVLRSLEDDGSPELSIPILPAFRIGDLAEAMGAKMEITGLPDFEKKHEMMAVGNTSDTARRMSVEELREALKGV